MIKTITTVLLVVVPVVLIVVAYVLLRRKKEPVTVTPTEEPDIVEKVLDELLMWVRLYSQIRRLDERDFCAFCNSMIGGISMSIRNTYHIWAIHSGNFSNEIPAEHKALYWALVKRLMHKGYQSPHPDDMSQYLVEQMYRKYWANAPKEAIEEFARFQRYKNTVDYKPLFPFDVSMPTDKGYTNKLEL